MLTGLILTGVVFFLYGLFLRGQKTRVRGTASVIAARLPQGEPWSFGRGVWGLVLGPEIEKTLSAEVAEAVLAVSWRVSDAADLERADAEMSARMPAARTWRLVRSATLVRLAVAGRVLDAASGSARLELIAQSLTSTHRSWEDLAKTFAAEHQRFLEADDAERSGSDATPGLARLPEPSQLARSRAWLEKSVWPDVVWRVPPTSG
jgi:hypothetical protein